jgi:plastocyanin
MKKIVLTAIVGFALATAGPAGAATWQAWLGEPGAAPAGSPKGATLNQFFPRVIKIHAGDRIRYSTHNFHTATYLGPASPGPIAFPDPSGSKYSGIVDSTGAPFWFNGLPKFIYNPETFGPVGSPVVTPGAEHSTGVVAPSTGPTGSAVLSFPKAGTYKMFCLIHPGMSETVIVKAKKAKADTKVTAKTRIAKESTALWAATKALANTSVPANTVFAGVGSSATLLAFLPATLTVPAGTTVNFVNMSPSEIHNQAFGPSGWINQFMQQTDLLPLGPGASNQTSPVLIYGSEIGQPTYNGSNHGNGFLATGLTDDQPGDPPTGLPQARSVTFTKPGTYGYYCLIHGPSMSGEIIVTG